MFRQVLQSHCDRESHRVKTDQVEVLFVKTVLAGVWSECMNKAVILRYCKCRNGLTTVAGKMART